MSEKELSPCQKLWLKNKVYDIFGGVYLVAPCSYFYHHHIAQISTWGEPDMKSVIPVMLDECARQCRFSCDIENVFLDRIDRSTTKDSDRLWEDYAAQREKLGFPSVDRELEPLSLDGQESTT